MNTAVLSRLALVAATLTITPLALHADPISIATSAIPTITIAPSSDTVTLDATTQTFTSASGTIAFQTGNVYIGYSPIPDQVIPFSFQDTITIDGVTETITIFGVDNVTTAVDVFTFFAGDPVQFGDVTFTLDSSVTDPGGVGANLPFTLSADLAQTPEPTSLAMTGTGLLGALAIIRRKLRA